MLECSNCLNGQCERALRLYAHCGRCESRIAPSATKQCDGIAAPVISFSKLNKSYLHEVNWRFKHGRAVCCFFIMAAVFLAPPSGVGLAHLAPQQKGNRKWDGKGQSFVDLSWVCL